MLQSCANCSLTYSIPLLQEVIRLTFNDALRLFVCQNDAMLNVLGALLLELLVRAEFYSVCFGSALERYFTMSKKDATMVLEIYERFTQQCLGVDELCDSCRVS